MIVVYVRWWDGHAERFKCSEARIDSDLLWMRLHTGENRHIHLRRIHSALVAVTPESHDMRESTMKPDHVIDRHGHVWTIVRPNWATRDDGEFRATTIDWLEEHDGPLVRFNGAEMYAREAHRVCTCTPDVVPHSAGDSYAVSLLRGEHERERAACAVHSEVRPARSAFA